MAVLDGYLYVGTTAAGGQLWRTADGLQWDQASDTGFGNADNSSVSSLYSSSGYLYAGTRNETSGAEIWRSTDGVTWTVVVTGGFGVPTNVEVAGFGSSNGALYAAVTNEVRGVEVWYSGDGVVWLPSATGGFDAGQAAVVGSAGGNGAELVVGTNDALWGTGCQVWSTTAGLAWDLTNSAGFGDPSNEQATAATAWNGLVFVGTRNDNGLEIWTKPEAAFFSNGFETGNLEGWASAVP
jgi:hypothetical protein